MSNVVHFFLAQGQFMALTAPGTPPLDGGNNNKKGGKGGAGGAAKGAKGGKAAPAKAAAAPATPTAAAPKSFDRRDLLVKIQKEVQAKWAETKAFEIDAPTDAEGRKTPKFMALFPYPYMNGRLHLGHTFTVTKAEFAAAYHRLRGDNVLFPFAFHVTGMPIKACADRLKREMEEFGTPPQFPAPKAISGKMKTKDIQKGGANYQWDIMKKMGIADADIPAFAETDHWLSYFPPHCKSDLNLMGAGIDWRRSFITTDANPYYDALIRWQFRKLKTLGKIKFGARPTVFSPKDGQPCLDHDRKSGEGHGPQEYTVIKLKALEPFPESMAHLAGRNVFLAPATLRPETMYGQTNCFVLPSGKYGAFEVSGEKDGDVFIMSARAARNMAFQGLSPGFGKMSQLGGDIMGKDLVGLPLKAPLTSYERVYTLPLMTISMNKGTGVVTSVPSDAPDDWAALMDLVNKPKVRAEHGVKEEWVAPFKPIPIINIPEFGDMAAQTVVEQLKITSQHDTVQLAKAKEMTYTAGFYKGVLTVGPHKGMAVKDAKVVIREEMIKSGDAVSYSEPEGLVISRSGDECVVAMADQWYLTYGEEKWQSQVYSALEKMDTYGSETREQMKIAVGWLNQWACSRTYGLGTRLPFDEKWLIESLSDSTIYMAYYTIAHLLQGGDAYGQTVGPAGIKPEQLTDAVWDHIFLGMPLADGATTIPTDVLAKLRSEFTYWYPFDVRVSGKDLIQNHLTFMLYNHCAIFPEEHWPAGMRTNGHLLLDGRKMSKGEGIFISLEGGVQDFSADAMRFALADAGDGLGDGNFVEATANSAILRLTKELTWFKDVLGLKGIATTDTVSKPEKTRTGDMSWADRVFANELNGLIEAADKAYERMMFREALRVSFYEMQTIRDWYRVATAAVGMHKDLVTRFVVVQTALLAPITPHLSEHVFAALVGAGLVPKADSVFAAGMPKPNAAYDGLLHRQYLNVEGTLRAVRTKIGAAGKPKKGKKAAAPTGPPTGVTLVVAPAFPKHHAAALKLMSAHFDTEKKELNDKAVIAAMKSDATLKPQMKTLMGFVMWVRDQVAAVGQTAMDEKLPFDEAAVLKGVEQYALSNLNVHRVGVVLQSEADADKLGKSIVEGAMPGTPGVVLTYDDKAPAAPAKAAADDDMDDLFDSDSEDEEAGEARRKKIVEEHRARLAAAGKAKKVVVAKSIVTFDVKPWDDTTDMDALTKECLAIKMEGLVWGSHKLIPVAFGVKKLNITCVIEDDKVSTQDLEDKIADFEDYVQSVDIASFQKV